jgi:TPR repeat protein
LGYLFLGKGVEQSEVAVDLVRAAALFKQAAEQVISLFVCVITLLAVKQSLDNVQGHVNAMFNFGSCCYNGEGVEVDLKQVRF